jgi:hypothetical protein
MKHHSRGFIALISIIIISVMLLATTLSLAQFGIASRYFILDLENKRASEKLAEACVHIARIQTYNDPEYEVSSPISYPVGESTCSVYSINSVGDDTTIEAQAQSGDSITNLHVVVDNTNGDFTEWQEMPNL